MPTPLFAFRLAKPDRKKLEELARIYGSPNPSAFVREMVTAICSGELGQVNGFLSRLGEKLSGQLHLELQQQVKAQIEVAREQVVQEAAQSVQDAPKAPKRGKGRRRRARPT